MASGMAGGAARLVKSIFGPDRRLAGWFVATALVRRGGGNVTFSQEGEDLIFHRLFDYQRNGFFVDVGAHNPTRFSNTMALYLRGWHGINVDAMPGSMKPFRKMRRRDVNLECGVSATAGELVFNVFDEPAINTFDERLVQVWIDKGMKLVQQVKVPTRPLAQILDEHLPPGQHIDVMSVDVEGLDAEVLASNDWTRYRPTVVCIERFESGPDDPPVRDAGDICIEQGYTLVASSVHSQVYALPDFLDEIGRRRRATAERPHA